MEDTLKEKGIEYVILCPYSNEYNGYITTYEEYQAQMYEAGHNVFGQWSLNALQQKLTELSKEFIKPMETRNTELGIHPEIFSKEEIQKQAFMPSKRVRKAEKNK